MRNPFVTLNNSELFSLPAGPVGAAFGIDYRIESLLQNPDAISLLGDDGGGAEYYVDKARKVFAYFGELQIPLVSPKQGIPGLHDLSIDVAARDENFLTTHLSKLVPSAAIRYQPLDNTLTLRGSYGQGIRQPSLYEMYGGTASDLLTLYDPNGAEPETTILKVSNPNLKPETSTSVTAGIVWSPNISRLKGFTVNIDFWRVERNGTVYTSAQDVLDRYWGVHQAPGPAQGTPATGGLITSNEGVTYDKSGNLLAVTAPYHNSGQTIAQGIDMSASYLLETSSWGRFDFTLGATDLLSYKQSLVAGTPLVQMVNQDASQGQGMDGYVRWKGKANVSWTLRQWSAEVTGNYTSGFQDYNYDDNFNLYPFEVATMTTFDGQFSYALSGKYFADTKVTVGALNAFDRSPPFASGSQSNSVSYPGFLYDPTGRFVYAQMTKKF